MSPGRGITAPASLIRASVDAPFRARGNFRTVVARGRMLPSVRPLVRQRTAAGLYGSSRTGSQITAAYSRYGVAHWLSRSRLADRCAMPSFRSPHALAAPARLRGRRRSPINAPLDQQGPDNAAVLLARATVTSIFGLRASIRASHEPAGVPR